MTKAIRILKITVFLSSSLYGKRQELKSFCECRNVTFIIELHNTVNNQNVLKSRGHISNKRMHTYVRNIRTPLFSMLFIYMYIMI